MDKDDLLKIIEDDDLGLLSVKSKLSSNSADERLVAKFQEICDFVKEHNRLPEANRSDMREMQLHSRLNGLREDEKKCEALRIHDEQGILGEPKKIESLADIFDDDDLGLLQDEADNIFVLKNVPLKEVTAPAEYVARRKACKDFDKFEGLFKQCQQDLSSSQRTLNPFTDSLEIHVGDFFVLKGMLVYVAEEGAPELASYGAINIRLRCIFDNGTESNMLMRSLAARLYEQAGSRVSVRSDQMARRVNEITDEDRLTGYIYILKSKSDRPEIKAIKNLYKIGFATTTVEERIKNAAQEPTYLMAPVSIVTTFHCYNLNTHKLETLLHHFFGKACLDLDVYDKNGRRCIPKEWFVAPLDIITKAVEMLITGEIVEYRYDEKEQKISKR
jgi:T5orf172 domain